MVIDLHNTTMVAMSQRKSRAAQIRDYLSAVLAKIPEYHTSKAAQDTLQDVEEMMYSLWEMVGVTHGKARK